MVGGVGREYGDGLVKMFKESTGVENNTPIGLINHPESAVSRVKQRRLHI